MKLNFFQKIIVLLIAISFVIGLDYYLFLPKRDIEPEKPAEVNVGKEEKLNETTTNLVSENITSSLGVEEKQRVYLEVPFASQAPKGDWDDLHNEACEEAALVMAKYWLEGKKLTGDAMDDEIVKSVAWEEGQWGGHYDLPVDKIVELAKEYFGIEKIRAVYNIENIERIKKELSQGNLVIVPTAGRLLDNTHYRQPGPVYHMLVIKGFNKSDKEGKEGKEMITNDPGTKVGKDFRYSPENLFISIHDWPAGTGRPLLFGQNLSKDEAAQIILRGQRAMMVIEK